MNDVFYSCLNHGLNATLKQIAFTDTKTMIFCSKFTQKLFTKTFEATTSFWKLDKEYPNTKIFQFYIFVNEMVITRKIRL